MIPAIPKLSYLSDQTFKKEKTLISQDCWIYVGNTANVPNSEDYLTADVWGQSIFVQNFSGELRAFRNACTHRFSRLKNQKFGHGPLQCPYHGWIFNKDGLPVGIPRKKDFHLCDEDQDELRLEVWQVETCGSFIFVKKSNGGPNLKNYLGKLFDEVRAISDALGKKIDSNEMAIGANWKVVVENTLENYHVHTIHPQSFEKLGANGQEFEFHSPHSAWETPLNEKTERSWEKINNVFDSRPIIRTGYRHIFIFPNLTIASAFGTSFSLQEIIPLSPQSTTFISHVYFTRFEKTKPVQTVLAESLMESIVKFDRQVFDEDKVICEEVQQGIAQSEKSGFLCAMEARVVDFQKMCARYYQET